MAMFRVFFLLCCLVESILCSTVPINVVQIKASGKSGSKFKLTAKCVFGDMEPVIPAENATFTIQLDRPTTKFSSKQVTVQSTGDTSYTVTNKADITKTKFVISISVIFNTPPRCFPTGTCSRSDATTTSTSTATTTTPPTTTEPDGTGRKNVLFLVADDLRVQLGSYEGSYFASSVHPNMYTPNLDKLATKSMVLKRAYVQQAVCAPSRTSLLTGRRPDTTLVWDLASYWRNVSGNFTTIPQYFKNHGYTSIGMGKIFHPGAASGFDDPLSWSRSYWRPVRTAWETNGTSWIAVPDTELNDHPLVDEQVANHAVDTLRSLAANSESVPWFMAVGFYKPHLPFVFPASVLRHYPENTINLPDNPYAPVNMPRIAWASYNELRKFNDIKAVNATGNFNTTLPDTNVLELRRAYYSAVTWMDSQVGRILDELDRLNMSDNTIISFFGDHGWQLGEHAEWCKHTNFDIATHAPMMIRIPGMTDSGITTEKLTEFVDLFPTLVEAAGLPELTVCPMNSSHVLHCSEGSSVMPLIRNPNAPWKNAVYSQYPRRTRGQNAMGYTMTTSKYRYTEWVRVTYEPTFQQDWSTVYEAELYDHTNDPEENQNVADESHYAHIKDQLSLELRAGWRDNVTT